MRKFIDMSRWHESMGTEPTERTGLGENFTTTVSHRFPTPTPPEFSGLPTEFGFLEFGARGLRPSCEVLGIEAGFHQ